LSVNEQANPLIRENECSCNTQQDIKR
jgi:hypothetical protein